MDSQSYTGQTDKTLTQTHKQAATHKQLNQQVLMLQRVSYLPKTTRHVHNADLLSTM